MNDVDFITTGDGCRIAWRFDGPQDAPVLLLSNSLGTNMAMWQPQLAALSAKFRVLRYDQRGHGRSDAPAGGYSMDRLGRDVIELIDALGLNKIYFCGLSLGGMVGQWLSFRAPDRVERLVLANTSAYMGPPANWQQRIDAVLTTGMAPLTEASIARWFTASFPASDPDAVAPIRDMLLANNPSGYAGCCAAIRDMDMRPTATLNHIPTLVIAGDLDPSTSLAEAHFIADSASSARVATLPAAHLSNVECQQAFADLVIGHLSPDR